MSQLENKYTISESQIEELKKHVNHLFCHPILENTIAQSVENLENFVQQTKEDAKSIDEILRNLEVLEA